jgi:hypothetical protein
VPFSFFAPSGDGTKPDFSKVRVTDIGHTVALGDYEASADAILYEADRAYRYEADALTGKKSLVCGKGAKNPSEQRFCASGNSAS